jgi:hypothetical protein
MNLHETIAHPKETSTTAIAVVRDIPESEQIREKLSNGQCHKYQE